MLFKDEKEFKGVESFDSSKCALDNEKTVEFNKDEVAMGCCEGCWSGCIGGPHR